MKTSKSRKKAGFYVLSILVLALAFCVPAAAGVQDVDGEYEIYPTPQSIEYGDGALTFQSGVKVTYGDAVDDYTKTRVADTLAVLDLNEQAGAATNLIVGVYGSKDAADLYGEGHGVDAGLYEKYDAYTLWIQGNDIVILGKNADAAYYGVTTLKRIFEQLDGKSVRELTVKDYADTEFRGFIEGYYGNPWSHEDRLDLMQFGGEIKMNQYIYAPKDDPMHNSQWRELYDEEGLQRVAELARVGNESKCFFVYALHTFMNRPVDLSDAKYEAEVAIVKAKFEQVIREAGVRQIAILEDDAGGETAERMVRYLKDMNEWLKELQKEIPDLKTDILYCPNCYMNTTNAKLTYISENVSDEIHMVMTGGTIWGHVSQEFSDNFFNGLNTNGKGRRPYMWVNWPCNDNTKNSQIMGGHNTILHTGIEPGSYEGVVLNPIQESESSKVGIFTAADYTWNIWQDAAEGDQAWDDAFKYIDHMTPIETEESLALKEVAKHQIAQATTQPQTPFEESVELQPKLADFQTKLTGGSLTTEEIDALKNEFKVISDAADYYLESGTNRRMASQMTPFFSCLRDMTLADQYLMDALKASMENDKNAEIAAYMEAQKLYERSKTYGFFYYRAGTLYAKAGRKYIEPFTQRVLKHVSDEVKEIVAETESAQKYEGTISRTQRWQTTGGTSESSLTDGDDATFVWYDTKGEGSDKDSSLVGDYIQMDLGEAKPVGRVRILVGAEGGDKWSSYHLQYSVDGETWTELDSHTGEASGTDVYVEHLNGRSARYIRLVNDVKVKKWVKFSEFSVYSAPPADGVYTNTEGGEWEVETEGDVTSVLEKENAVLQPGEYVGVKLDRIHAIKNITASGTGMDALTVEKSMNGKEWSGKDEAGGARYIRLYNASNAAVTFHLTALSVETEEYKPMDLLETNLGGANNNEDPRKLGTTKAWMDGNLSTQAKYCAAPRQGDYITYDLGQEITLQAIKIYVTDTGLDYPRDAKLQASMDNQNWTDLLTIGDGVENGADDKDIKPVESENGGWIHDTVDVAYAYQENAEIPDVKARYIRLYFTAPYSHRWVEVNEILINNGAFIPSVNDPTYETDAQQQRGYELSNLTDGDLTTAFVPDGTQNGYLIYHLSDGKEIGRLNILQSGSEISNAAVSVRTAGSDVWERVGTLDRAYSAIYTKDYADIVAVKIEWEDVVPTIYEIISMSEPGSVLDDNIAETEKDLQAANDRLSIAVGAAGEAKQKADAAKGKVDASTGADKLRAEIEMNQLLAEWAGAEAEAAKLKAEKAMCEAAVADAQARKLRAQAALAESESDRAALLGQATQKEAEASGYRDVAGQEERNVLDKLEEQKGYRKKAEEKKEELDQFLQEEDKKDPSDPGNQTPDTPGPGPGQTPNPPAQTEEKPVTGFTLKGIVYEVPDAGQKTVTVAGPENKKKAKTVVIPATVSYGNVTYTVTEIKASAFKGCSKLKKVTIGSNVTKIGAQAFAQCKKLSSVNMKKAAKIAKMEKKAFDKISAKAKVLVPAKKSKQYKKMLKGAGLPKKATIK